MISLRSFVEFSLHSNAKHLIRCANCAHATGREHARALCKSTAYLGDHRLYLSEVALLNKTEQVSVLVKALQAQGHTIVQPNNNRGLHPLAVAVAEGSIRVWGQAPENGVLCILRWPSPSSHPNMEMPLVLMQRGGRSLQLVARSVKEYLTRLLADEDRAATDDASRPLAATLGPEGESLYQQGHVEAARMPKYEAYIVKSIGHFPDVSDSLIQSHLDRNDETSAMIAAEWTMKNMFYDEWAVAFELAASLYDRLGRDEEARDTARAALKQPWWTISGDLTRIRALSKMTGSAQETAALFEQERRGTGSYRTHEEIATPQEVAEQEAMVLMNQVACGEVATWDEIRPALVQLYHKAGKAECAKFIELSSAR